MLSKRPRYHETPISPSTLRTHICCKCPSISNLVPICKASHFGCQTAYRSAISPPARCLWCRNAWLPQKTRNTCVCKLALVLSKSRPLSGLNGRERTPYITTAPNTAAATPLPSLGSSLEPIMVWWPLANMLPITLRITMAKMEMTMLFPGPVSFPALFTGRDFVFLLVPCPCIEGGNDGLHGCW